MVDARAAVEMAFYLGETDQSTTIDWTVQNHLLNVTTEGGKVIITGHAWTQSDIIDVIEFRIGDGNWKEATYEAVPEELGPLTPFNWTIAIDLSSIPSGLQTIEVRATGANGHSLPVLVEVAASFSFPRVGAWVHSL